MINLTKIAKDTIDENLNLFLDSTHEPKDSPPNAKVYQALMSHSEILLTRYHKALQRELAKHGIEI